MVELCADDIQDTRQFREGYSFVMLVYYDIGCEALQGNSMEWIQRRRDKGVPLKLVMIMYQYITIR